MPNLASAFDKNVPLSQHVTIYHPLSHKIRGLASAKIAALIPPGSGLYKMIQNMRWGDTGVFRVRSGIQAALSGVICPSSTPRGFYTGTFNGDPSKSWASFKNASNRTQVFLGSSSESVWTDITPTTGAYGDTTLGSDGNNNDYETTFQVVHDRYGNTDCLVIQNGYDYPRVWDGTNMSVHRPITPPTASSKWGAVLTWRGWFVISDPANTTYTNAGTHFTLADTGAAGVNTVRLHSDGSAPTGTSTVKVPAAMNYLSSTGLTAQTVLNCTTSRQIIFIFRPVGATTLAMDHFLSNFTIQIAGVSTTNYTLFNPNSPIKQGTLVSVDDATQTWALALYVDDIATSDSATLDTITISAITSAVAPFAAYDLDIFAICASGNVPGGCDYALSYMNSASRAESYEQVIPTNFDQIDNLQGGSPVSAAPMNHLPVPDSTELFYMVNVFFQNTTDAEMNLGTDTLRVYRKDFGETSFLHVFDVDIAAFSGGVWSHTQSSAALQLRATVDAVASESRDLWLISPGAFQLPIPIARNMGFTGNRLLCAARTSQGVDSFPQIMMSRASMAFRFSSLPFDSTDPSAPLVQELAGDNVQAFAVFSAGNLGSASTYVFTDVGVYMLNMMAAGTPSILYKIASIGTGSPFSVVEHFGRVYFLDTDRQVQLIEGETMRRLTRGIVDDITTGIPTSRSRVVRGIWANNRYYLFYTPNGGTVNNQCLIFSENAEAWESNDLVPNVSGSPQGAEAVITWVSTTATYGTTSDRRIVYIGSDLKAYRYEVPTVNTDIGSLIATQITTGDLMMPMWDGLYVKGVGILADDQNGQNLTATITYKPDGGNQVFNVSLDSTGPYRYSIERTTTSATDPQKGVAASFDYTQNLIGERNIIGLYAEVEPREMFAPLAG